MSSYADGALQLSIDGAFARLTLNRPQARNAINAAMWVAIPEALAVVEADPAVRVAVLSGSGGHFAAGADIAEFPTLFATRESTLAYAAGLDRATRALAECGKPVIAAIDGFCLGAGLALALACDLRIASSRARLGAPPAKLGLIYSLADSKRLIDAVGASAARTMLYTAVVHPAEDALRLGLVDAAHAPEALEAELMATATTIASLSPWSVRHAKAVVRLIVEGATAETEQTRGWFADAIEGADFAEGLAAFQARRPPRFGG